MERSVTAWPKPSRSSRQRPLESGSKQLWGESRRISRRRRDDAVRLKHLAVFLVKPFEVLMEVLRDIHLVHGLSVL